MSQLSPTHEAAQGAGASAALFVDSAAESPYW
jgi:hypothetical protein